MNHEFKGAKTPTSSGPSANEAINQFNRAQQIRSLEAIRELRKSSIKCKGMTDLEIIIFALEWTLDNFKY